MTSPCSHHHNHCTFRPPPHFCPNNNGGKPLYCPLTTDQEKSLNSLVLKQLDILASNSEGLTLETACRVLTERTYSTLAQVFPCHNSKLGNNGPIIHYLTTPAHLAAVNRMESPISSRSAARKSPSRATPLSNKQPELPISARLPPVNTPLTKVSSPVTRVNKRKSSRPRRCLFEQNDEMFYYCDEEEDIKADKSSAGKSPSPVVTAAGKPVTAVVKPSSITAAVTPVTIAVKPVTATAVKPVTATAVKPDTIAVKPVTATVVKPVTATTVKPDTIAVKSITTATVKPVTTATVKPITTTVKPVMTATVKPITTATVKPITTTVKPVTIAVKPAATNTTAEKRSRGRPKKTEQISLPNTSETQAGLKHEAPTQEDPEENSPKRFKSEDTEQSAQGPNLPPPSSEAPQSVATSPVTTEDPDTKSPASIQDNSSLENTFTLLNKFIKNGQFTPKKYALRSHPPSPERMSVDEDIHSDPERSTSDPLYTSPSAGDGSSTKRGRGRPPFLPKFFGPKRKRGRPRIKSPEPIGPKRPRGRPRLFKMEDERNFSGEGEKRGPGRPRKMPVKQEFAEFKRGRGRPRTRVIDLDTPKRPRGRPRKEDGQLYHRPQNLSLQVDQASFTFSEDVVRQEEDSQTPHSSPKMAAQSPNSESPPTEESMPLDAIDSNLLSGD